MKKVLLFLIAILYYSTLAAEALTCINCEKTEMGENCVSREESKTCIAHPGQKCLLSRYTQEGGQTTIYSQSCPTDDGKCDLTVTAYEIGVWEFTCCDDRDLCNKP